MALSESNCRGNPARRLGPLTLLSFLALSLADMCGDTRLAIDNAGVPLDATVGRADAPPEFDPTPYHGREKEALPEPARSFFQHRVRAALTTPSHQNVVQPPDLDTGDGLEMLRASLPEETQVKWDVLQRHCDAFFSTTSIDDDVPYSLQSLEQIGIVYQSLLADLVSNGVSGSLLNASLEDACSSLGDLNNHAVYLATELMGSSRVNTYEKSVILADFKKVLENFGLPVWQLEELADNLFPTSKDYAGYAGNLINEIRSLACNRRNGFVAGLYKLSMTLDSMTPEQLGIDQKEYDYLSGIVNPDFNVLIQDLHTKFASTYMDYLFESQDGLNDRLNHVLGLKIAAYNALEDLINAMLLYGFSSQEIDPALDWPKLLVLREELQSTPEDEESYYSGYPGFNEYIGMTF